MLHAFVKAYTMSWDKSDKYQQKLCRKIQGNVEGGMSSCKASPIQKYKHLGLPVMQCQNLDLILKYCTTIQPIEKNTSICHYLRKSLERFLDKILWYQWSPIAWAGKPYMSWVLWKIQFYRNNLDLRLTQSIMLRSKTKWTMMTLRGYGITQILHTHQQSHGLTVIYTSRAGNNLGYIW